MSLFAGTENFTPALEGQRIAIGAGAAMRQGLQGIEQIGEMDRMKKWLDEFKNSLNADYGKRFMSRATQAQYPDNAAPPTEGFYASW